MRKIFFVLVFILFTTSSFAYTGQGCSIEATAAVYLENQYYGEVTVAEAQEAWNWYYSACMEVGHNSWEGPVFL